MASPYHTPLPSEAFKKYQCPAEKNRLRIRGWSPYHRGSCKARRVHNWPIASEGGSPREPGVTAAGTGRAVPEGAPHPQPHPKHPKPSTVRHAPLHQTPGLISGSLNSPPRGKWSADTLGPWGLGNEGSQAKIARRRINTRIERLTLPTTCAQKVELMDLTEQERKMSTVRTCREKRGWWKQETGDTDKF